MASFEAKEGWKKAEKQRNKNYISVTILPDGLEKIPKKQQKNLKNQKNNIMASFKPKIGWKRQRRRENKNYRSLSFLHDA